MYMFYIDESGEKNGEVKRDEPFVLLAIGIHEFNWKKFENRINSRKTELLSVINSSLTKKLFLKDVELHSSVLRQVKARERDPFFSLLTNDQITSLVNVFYDALHDFNISIFAVVIDKANFVSNHKSEVLTKAYELLLERIDTFLRVESNKNNGIIVMDQSTRSFHLDVFSQHFRIQNRGTSAVPPSSRILEIPFTVDSRLSNGIQLTDLCAYNFYRVFKYNEVDYSYFLRCLPFVRTLKHKSRKSDPRRIEGLKLFPSSHRWQHLEELIKNKKAQL